MNIPKERVYFNFDLFSQQEEYQDVNLQFVNKALPADKILSGDGLTVGDFACETGLITSILLEKLQDRKRKIIWVDPNPAAIEVASDGVKSIGKAKVEFDKRSAKELLNLIAPQSVDMTYFCKRSVKHHLIKQRSPGCMEFLSFIRKLT